MIFNLETVKACPVQVALSSLGKKWALNIIRDLFDGKKRFSEFLTSNPGLSTKMLSRRLKELEQIGLIDKQIVSKSPVLIEYVLTLKGMALNKIIYEISVFSIEHFSEDVFTDVPNSFEPAFHEASQRFGIIRPSN